MPDRVLTILDTAIELYGSLTEPRGILEELSGAEFAALYRGEGRNEDRTPLAGIQPRAEHLALFAVTLGEPLGREIGELFAANEPALGYVLDSIASERADRGAELMSQHFLEALGHDGRIGRSARVLPYSPGYCGWHLSGQRALFARLRPERIGIKLNESCLMQPLKSVSGVLVAGPPEIHVFDNDFDFCGSCATRHCRDRMLPRDPTNEGASE